MPPSPSEPHIDSSPQDTAKPSAQGVTLLVPAFNEENGIEGVVRRLAALDLGTRTEVLVVEDGSSDGTGAKLEQLQKEIEHERARISDTAQKQQDEEADATWRPIHFAAWRATMTIGD